MQDSEPAYQTLLEGVERVEFFVRDSQSGQPRNFWPPLGGTGSVGSGMETVGIVMHLELVGYGDIDRVWEIPNMLAPLNAATGAGGPGGAGPTDPSLDTPDFDDEDDDEA